MPLAHRLFRTGLCAVAHYASTKNRLGSFGTPLTPDNIRQPFRRQSQKGLYKKKGTTRRAPHSKAIKRLELPPLHGVVTIKKINIRSSAH